MRISGICMCLWLAACGGGIDANGDGIIDGAKAPDSVSMVAPSTPVGTISGQILTTSLTALDGAQVAVTIGATIGDDSVTYRTNTDGDGNFKVKGLPAGANAQVTISKMDYASARVSTFVPGNAGNFPINNGNGNVGTILLTRTNDTFKMQIVTAAGRPAKGAKATVEVTPAAVRYQENSIGYGTPVGVVVVETVPADDNGFVEFKNVPSRAEESRLNGNYAITVAPLDDDADGDNEFLGIRQDISARALYLDSAPHVLILPYNRGAGPVRLLASNVDSLLNPGAPVDPFKNMVKTNELYFVFDQAIVFQSLAVKVTDESGTVNQSIMPVLKGSNILLVPLQAGAEQGKEYNIAMRVSSAENGSTFAGTGFFFGGDPAMPKQIGIEKITYRVDPVNVGMPPGLRTGERVVITFNQPIKLVAGQAFEVLIDAEIDGLTGRGTGVGEKSAAGQPVNTNGFPTAPNEPIAERGSTFSNAPSGYTTRHEFTYTQTLTVALNTSMTLFFSEIPSTLGGYHTLWGTPIEADLTAVLSQ